MDKNVVGWFEIPVENMERAVEFYEAVFSFKITLMQMGGGEMGIFPSAPDAIGAGGALVKHPEFYQPSANGVVVYFTAHSGDLSIELGRVKAAGGQVVSEKKMIAPDVGYMGLFMDTEGNRIALHSKA